MRIFFFGDSITHGFYDEQGGWAQRLCNEYHALSLEKLGQANSVYIEAFNLGVSGDTAGGLAKRIESDIDSRRLYKTEDIIVIAIGINDAPLINNRAVKDVYDFEDEIEKVIKNSQKITSKILLVGLTAVDESMTNPWPYSSRDRQFFNNRINLFEDTVKQCANRDSIKFVPLHDEFLANLEAGQKLLADGLHPNSAGHRWIASRVKPVIDKLIEP